MMKRIKVKEAASVLGVSEQFIRIGMQRGWLPIGSCVKLSSKWTYHISPYLLEQYIGTKKPPCGNMTANPLGKPAERTI